jgi:antitoxin PrlF
MPNKPCCSTKECCKIDAVVSVDAKGQIVLPKELRQKANINPNDKIAIIAFEQDNEVKCIVMLKADALQDTVKSMLGPVFQNVFKVDGKENE